MSRLKQFVKIAFPPAVTAVNIWRNFQQWLRWKRLSMKNRAQIFTDYFDENQWGDSDSRSGSGSNLDTTHVVREILPGLVNRLDASSMLDLPCGDFFWMREVDLGKTSYTGCDIVEAMVTVNNEKYRNEKRRFLVLDMCKDDLPESDLIFCRDALVHLSLNDIRMALANFKKSGAHYLVTTTFTSVSENKDIATGMWRAINLCRPPFSFPKPLELINEQYEGHHGRYRDKSLGVWRIKDLP